MHEYGDQDFIRMFSLFLYSRKVAAAQFQRNEHVFNIQDLPESRTKIHVTMRELYTKPSIRKYLSYSLVRVFFYLSSTKCNVKIHDSTTKRFFHRETNNARERESN